MLCMATLSCQIAATTALYQTSREFTAQLYVLAVVVQRGSLGRKCDAQACFLRQTRLSLKSGIPEARDASACVDSKVK